MVTVIVPVVLFDSTCIQVLGYGSSTTFIVAITYYAHYLYHIPAITGGKGGGGGDKRFVFPMGITIVLTRSFAVCRFSSAVRLQY